MNDNELGKQSSDGLRSMEGRDTGASFRVLKLISETRRRHEETQFIYFYRVRHMTLG